MKSIRIGNDIRIEWPIVLSGDVSKLQDLDLMVEVRPSAKIIDTHNYADAPKPRKVTVMMNGGITCRPDIGDGKEHCRPRPCPPHNHRPVPPAPVRLPYHIEDNTLIAMWTADRQFATGDYDIILYAHKNEGGQAVCDQYRFVRLVSHTAEADAPDDSGIEAVIAMQPVTLELSGLSAYEVAVVNGFQGTEEEWLQSLKQPAIDAAEQAKEDIEQFKTETKAELKEDIEALGYYEDNPEFIRVYTDAEGKFLWGIRVDGSIEWAKGVPTPVQNALKELADKIKDLGGDKIEKVETALNEKIEALQDAIDVINASLKPLTDTFSYQDNEEFAHVITDAEGKVLFGIKVDGSPYYPNNEMYHVIQNEEYLAAWVDANNKILFGIKTDGSTYIAKSELIDKISEIRQLIDKYSIVLDGISYVDNPEFLNVVTDSEGKVLEATKPDGTKYFPKQEMLEKYDDPEERTEITVDAENRVLAYRNKKGIKHEEKLALNEVYDKDNNKLNLATKEDLENVNPSNVSLSSINGVQDHSLPNLFDKSGIRTYDSDFADKVFAAIGNKTGETGCYSNNIECKEGDWFTRSDFGTGIIVVLDENENILGNVANAAYQPTVQIKPADPKYDFSTAKYAVFVVMLENLDSERIVKAKYMPTGEGDYLTIPKLRIEQGNIDKDSTPFFRSSKGKYYQITIDDSGETPTISLVDMTGIPMSELPSDFPTFKVSGDFSGYYDGLVFCPIEGGVTNYLYELGTNGLVQRFIKKKVNCPRILNEDGILYYYGVTGDLNYSNGYLNIYKASGESFELVAGNLGGGEGGSLQLEPHDCVVISVNPIHYIYQRYVPNQNTIVDGMPRIVTSLHIGEMYDGQLLSEWHSEDYPELWVDSHVQGNNADYLHNNTICLTPEGNISLNNKQANQIIVLKRTWNEEEHTSTIGDILWKIGGNRTHSGWDVPTRIKTTTEQQWYESHDSVVNADGLYTMYDNKASGASRILEFKIDTETKQLTNFKAHTWQQYRGRYMGSVDKLEEGIYLISWGSQRNGNAANAGIYDFNTSKAIFEIRFDNTGSSAYRVYGIPKGE